LRRRWGGGLPSGCKPNSSWNLQKPRRCVPCGQLLAAASAAAALYRSPRSPPPPSSALINPVVPLLASTFACPLKVLPGNHLACRSWRLGGRLLQQMQHPVAFQNAASITASACTHLQLFSDPPPNMAVSIPENVRHSPRPPFPSRCSRAPPPPPPPPVQATRWVIQTPLSLVDCNCIAALLPASCPDLQQLSLQGVAVAPAGVHDLLQCLSELPALRILYLGSCK